MWIGAQTIPSSTTKKLVKGINSTLTFCITDYLEKLKKNKKIRFWGGKWHFFKEKFWYLLRFSAILSKIKKLFCSIPSPNIFIFQPLTSPMIFDQAHVPMLDRSTLNEPNANVK